MKKRQSARVRLTQCLGAIAAALLCGGTVQSGVVGQWEFNGNLNAAVGAALQYLDGPGGPTQLQSQFTTMTIGGESASVMQFPACDSTAFMGYYLSNPAAGNGGGSLVNQWTMVLDLMYPAASSGKWRAIFEADGRASTDSDFFINTANGIGISGSYQGLIQADTWHRVAIVVDQSQGVNEIRKYIDGVKVGTQAAGGVDGRWGLAAGGSTELFNDNDGDVAPGTVNSIQLRDEVLTDAQILALGGASAAGVPQSIPSIPAFVETRVPAANAGAAPALPLLRAVLNGGSTTVNTNSIRMQFDAADLQVSITSVGNTYTVSHQWETLLVAGSVHQVTFIWQDSAAGLQTNNWAFTVSPYQVLPEPYARAVGSANTRGMLFRTVMATVGTPTLPTTLARARAQLNGTLEDPQNPGTLLGNDATPGPLSGYYAVDTVNFDQAAAAAGNIAGDLGFPGLLEADNDSFATETLTYIDLPAGYYRMGVNSDDGFEVTVGTPPQSPVSSVSLGAYDGGRGVGDTAFDFVVTKPGVYAFRLVYFEGSGGASVEWFTQNTVTGERILVNDASNAQALAAYRVQTGVTEGPFVRSATPMPGETGTKPDTSITLEIEDGVTALASGSVVLKLNDATVTATQTKVGKVTTLRHTPATPLAYNTTNTVALTFGDGTTTQTLTWTFTTRKAEQAPAITGQWDFDSGDLSATVGEAMEYLSNDTAPATSFGTTTEFGLPKIGGSDARVLKFLGASANTIGYVVKHGAVPNGGGNKVNQWTLILDILMPVSEQYFSFCQIDNLSNGNDGDLFVNWNTPGDPDGDGVREGGIGIGGTYSSAEEPPPYMVAGQWHRVVFAVDHRSEVDKTLPDGTTTTEAVINKYVDGKFFGSQLRGANQLDGRHSLFDRFLLFADEDGESQLAYLNSAQVRNYTMSRAEIAALGAPAAAGIPTVSGQWDFEEGTLAATLGKDMEFVGTTGASTTFSSSTIGGQSAKVMAFPAVTQAQGFRMYHGGVPNAGGEFVNQYTLVMDVMYPAASTGKWRALLQSSTNNSNDGEMFINAGNGIGISGGYQGSILADTWHRVAFAFDLTAGTVGKYIDGALVGQQALGAGVDSRWALAPYALLFTDEDGEVAPGFVNSVQFRPVTLNGTQVAALGSATAAGIPLNLPFVEPPQTPPTLGVSRGGTSLTLTWDAKYTGFTLEESAAVSGGSWTPVSGVTGNAATLTIGTGAKFYRLRK